MCTREMTGADRILMDNIGKHLGLAMDGMPLDKAVDLASLFYGEVSILKVNDLAVRESVGKIVACLRLYVPDGGVWIDLKSYDTDGTMENEMNAIREGGGAIATVHLINSRAALSAALKAAGPDCVLSGVSILTSYKEEEILENFARTADEMAVLLIQKAKALGFKSIVCSAKQLSELLKAGLLDGIVPIIPGTRSMTSSVNDIAKLKPQTASGSTEEVFAVLARYKKQGIVVLGSEVYTDKDPLGKLLLIKESIASHLVAEGLSLMPGVPLLGKK